MHLLTNRYSPHRLLLKKKQLNKKHLCEGVLLPLSMVLRQSGLQFGNALHRYNTSIAITMHCLEVGIVCLNL